MVYVQAIGIDTCILCCYWIPYHTVYSINESTVAVKSEANVT